MQEKLYQIRRMCFFKILFTLILFKSTFSIAQIQSVPGYIVTNSRDTLKGFIENRSKSSDYKSCYFKKDTKEKPKLYTPNDILAFGVNNLKYYETIKSKDESGKDKLTFGSILIPGRASLFRTQKEMYLRHDSLGTYSLRFDGTRDLIGMNKIRGKLNFLFSDCKGKRIPWDSITLTDEKIFELVNNYNVCKHSHVKINPKSKIPKLRGSLGLFAGINSSTLQFSPFETNLGTRTLQNTKFENSSSSIVGLSYSLSFPRFNSNFSLYAELSYFKTTNRGHADGVGVTGDVETEDVAFSANYLKTAVGVRVQLPARGVTPFIKFGISNYTGSNFSGSRTRIVYVNDVPVTNVTSPWTSGDQSGIWLGGGVQKRISGKLAISVEARFDRTNGFNGPFPGFPLNGSHTTFLMGVVF